MVPEIIKNILVIALGIGGIGLLIGFHELGHFLFAKLFKVSTPSFSIGMGPKIFKKKIGETTFSLSAIPLGGYVEIAGMAEVGQGDQKEAQRRDQHSFAVKPYYQKLLILSGGIIFNLVLAYTFFVLLFMVGIPKTPILYPNVSQDTIVENIKSGSAAHKYHLKPNDKIVAINNESVINPRDFVEKISALPAQEVKITLIREDQTIDLQVVLDTKIVNNKNVGTIGISSFKSPEKLEIAPKENLNSSLKNALKTTNLIFISTVYTFKNMFTKKSIEGLGGPIAVISQTIKGAHQGFRIFLLLLAFLSISLAVLNLVPLPILDGGQIAFTTIETLIRRPLPDNIKIVIHYICWIAILLLAIFISIEDIKKILRG